MGGQTAPRQIDQFPGADESFPRDPGAPPILRAQLQDGSHVDAVADEIFHIRDPGGASWKPELCI